MRSMWAPTTNAKYGVAVHSYDGTGVSRGLRFCIGEAIQIMEECQGWYRGIIIKDCKRKGVFPASYVHLLKCQVDVEGPEECPVPVQDPFVSEIAYVLQEWHQAWKHIYLKCSMNQFHLIHKVMMDLVRSRQELVSQSLTQEQIQKVRQEVTAKIDTGNKRLGLDVVPRKDGVQVDSDTLSAVELYLIHDYSVEMAQQLNIRPSLRIRLQSAAGGPRTHHLHVSCHSLDFSTMEEMEVMLALYDAKTTKFFSESFVLRSSGSSESTRRSCNGCCVFTDLGSKDLVREVYIVATVHRICSLKEDSSRGGLYRRPYGCAALPIKDLFMSNVDESDDPRDSVLKGFTCNNDGDFPQLLDNIIRKQLSKSFLPGSPNNFSIAVSLRMLHGNLPEVKKSKAVWFRNVSIAQKMGFADVILPETLRNDLYLTLHHGEFERGTKSAAKNIEARFIVVERSGQLLQDCICPGAGVNNVSELNSTLYYHNNSPKWNESIRLNVPFDCFHGCHIRIEFRHCSRKSKTEKKLFAFSFVKLVTDDQTTLCDGGHDLLIYKCDDVSKLQNPCTYLHLPSGPSELRSYGVASSPFKTSDKESLHIETMLCSTKLTQNVDLLGLLKWKDHLDKIDTNLEKLMSLEGEEIVKFLQDIMDALFNMFALDGGRRIPQAQLVFKALVFIFNLLEDQKFVNFKPVLDNYLLNHFSALLVYRDMLLCLKEMLEAVIATTHAPSLQKNFQKSFRGLGYVTKFVVQSQLLFRRACGSQDTSDFQHLLNELFDILCQVLSLDNKVIATTQCVLLEHLPSMFEALSEIVPVPELCTKCSDVLSALPKKICRTESCLNKLRLTCLHKIIHLPKFITQEARGLLLPLCICQLKIHLVFQQELTLCAKILGSMLVALHADKQQGLDVTQSVQTILTSLLDIMIQTVGVLEMFNPRRGHLVACIIAMFRLMDDQHQDKLLKAHSDKAPFKAFLMRIFGLFQELVCMDLYPPDWVIMKIVTNNTILLAMQFLSQTLSGQFHDRSDFDLELWQSYFNTAVSFLTQHILQLEKFSEAKRLRILHSYGDMRVRMAYEVVAMWQNLGDHQIHFLPSVVGLFLDMTLVRQTELRQATIPLFYDMLESEHKERGHFKEVENELIDKFDLLISQSKGDAEYTHLFQAILLRKVEEAICGWQEDARSLIVSTSSLAERLLDYRSLMEGDEHRGKQMTCTVNLLDFYQKEVKRPEMYVRYVYKLLDLHLQQQNFTEAGLTLLLHAQMLSWDDSLLEADQPLGLVAEPEWIRKEQLYLRVISLMDQGKSWEYGIPLCKELASVYERRIAFDKLSKLLQMQSQYYVNILNETRPDPEYFKVGFFGQGFPLFLRNKEFVYRGRPLERISCFQKRLLEEFDQAKCMSGGTPVDDSLRNHPGQFLQLCPLRPVPSVDPAMSSADVPNAVRNFYYVNEVDTFQSDRPFHDGPKEPHNEFKTLHIDRTTVKIAQKLPGVLQWFEVTECTHKILTPIEVAIDATSRMNQKLQNLVLRYSSPDAEKSLNPLTMRLNGVIDAAVNGGIANYERAFFAEDPEDMAPEYRRHMSTLRALFLDQVRILGGALALHKRLVPREFHPLHEHLEKTFARLKQGIKESGSPNLCRLEQTNTIMRNDVTDSLISTPETPECPDELMGSHPSEPILNITPRSPCLAPATSSISLDSGIGRCSSSSQRRISSVSYSGDYTSRPSIPSRNSIIHVNSDVAELRSLGRHGPPIPPKRTPSLQSPRRERTISSPRPRRSVPAIPLSQLPPPVPERSLNRSSDQ